MNGLLGDFGQGFHYKVSNPNVSNNIPQMRSNTLQPTFIAGGNQVAYYLGIKGNTNTEPQPFCCGEYSAFKRVIKTHRKK